MYAAQAAFGRLHRRGVFAGFVGGMSGRVLTCLLSCFRIGLMHSFPIGDFIH